MAIPLFLAAWAWLIYAPGLGGAFHFDDTVNLEGLGAVGDASEALRFVLTGEAGPTGRPLALATFLLHAGTAPEGNAAPFLAVNITLHAINAALVWFFVYLLSRVTPWESIRRHAVLVATGSAAVWLAVPLLASSSLFVIQRMTTLSALFVLLGLCLHLRGHPAHGLPARQGLALMTTGLAVGLGAGVLAKETAALYPLLVLVLDRTLLAQAPRPTTYIGWRRLCILLPATLVMGYMLYRLTTGNGFEVRHFDAGERLLTQAVALFDYLRLLLLPVGSEIGPFQDAYPLYGGFHPAVAGMLLAVWVVAAVLAALYGSRYPIIAFGLLWFLTGHLLESTWLPLELYYEHRNYVPAIGLVTALVLPMATLPRRAGRLATIGVAAYVLALAIALVQVTSLWGTPRIAAELWFKRAPESPRAAVFLANYYQEENDPWTAIHVMDTAAEAASKGRTTLQIRALRTACGVASAESINDRYQSLLHAVPQAIFPNRQPSNDVDTIAALLRDVEEGRCPDVSAEQLQRLLLAYRSNPAVSASAKAVHNIHLVLARIARERNAPTEALRHLSTALKHHASLSVARTAAEYAHSHGAHAWLENLDVEHVQAQLDRWTIRNLEGWKALARELDVWLADSQRSEYSETNKIESPKPR